MIINKQRSIWALGAFLGLLVGSRPVAAWAQFFSDSSLSGPYIFEIIQGCTGGSSECVPPFTGIGTVTFNGQGSASANLLLENGNAVHPDTATGTYAVNGNGTGHLSLTRADTPAPGGGLIPCPALNSLDFVIADPFGLSAKYTNTGFCNLEAGGSGFIEDSYGTFFKRLSSSNFTNGSLSGNYFVRYFQSAGGVLLPGVGGGLLTFNGTGSLTGTIGFGGFGTDTVSGTYSVNSDGSATIQFPSGTQFVSNEDWSLLLADRFGSHSVFIDTSNNNGTETTGILEKRLP